MRVSDELRGRVRKFSFPLCLCEPQQHIALLDFAQRQEFIFTFRCYHPPFQSHGTVFDCGHDSTSPGRTAKHRGGQKPRNKQQPSNSAAAAGDKKGAREIPRVAWRGDRGDEGDEVTHSIAGQGGINDLTRIKAVA